MTHPLGQIMTVSTLMIIYDSSLSHYVFIVPSPYSLRKLMTSLSVFMIKYGTSLTHYAFNCALLSSIRTSNVFSLNPYDKKAFFLSSSMILLSLIMCFIVPFSHPLGQIMTSLNPYDKI
jgi:hypothetical protein